MKPHNIIFIQSNAIATDERANNYSIFTTNNIRKAASDSDLTIVCNLLKILAVNKLYISLKMNNLDTSINLFVDHIRR